MRPKCALNSVNFVLRRRPEESFQLCNVKVFACAIDLVGQRDRQHLNLPRMLVIVDIMVMVIAVRVQQKLLCQAAVNPKDDVF